MASLILKAKLNNSSLDCKLEVPTYLVIYGSGWESPTMQNAAHDAGNSFKVVAAARHKINKEKHPNSVCLLVYCPTDIEFFETINSNKNIEQLDVYCHGFAHGLNLGGFEGIRVVGGEEVDSKDIDWNSKTQNSGRDLRRVDIHEDVYFESLEKNELLQMNSNSFSDSVKVYFWGCNIGGQLTLKGEHVLDNTVKDRAGKLLSPKGCFAQKFAEQIGYGKVYALVGKGVYGGSVFKKDKNGKLFVEDGQLLPANIAARTNYLNNLTINAYDYMIEFPL